MATDARGHTVPAAADHPQRSDLLNLSLSANDAVMVADTTARTATATALSGSISTTRPLMVYRTDAVRYEITVDGTNWTPYPGTTDWAAYTPTLTNLTLGTGGTVTGRWKMLDDHTAMVRVRATLGSSGSAVGTGPDFSLPTGAPLSATNHVVQDAVGSGLALDASAGAAGRMGLSLYVVTLASPGRVGFAAAAGSVTISNPFTWAATDSLAAEAIYEV